MIKSLTVGDFIERTKDNLKIQILAGNDGMERTIAIADINRPGLALAGYLDFFAFDRVQVMGLTEVNYMKQLNPPMLRERLDRIFKYEIPCFIVTRGLTPPGEFIELADQASVPVLRSLLTTTEVVSKVADDVVLVRRRGDRFLYGEGSSLLRHHMEIRGVGIFDVKNIFGVGSIRNTKRISMIVELEDWDASKEYDRVGFTEDSYTVLEVKLPKITLPVRPGRNMAIIIEVAALNHRLREMGVDSERLLTEQLNQAIASAEKTPDDFEP
ncbi:MAG: hypothetical protein HY801_00975 [Candidatus Lindowbacteria bacterium]|nr:hypothetical protein [Candidatus Lindowbacteria bacterium]